MLARAISLLLLVPVIWCLFYFPFGSIWLGALLLAYFFTLQIAPHCWLIILPLLLPTFYLAPYSGWIFFDEFDLLVVVTLAGFLWSRTEVKRIKPTIGLAGKIVLFLFSVCYFVAMIRGFLPYTGFDKNSISTYYSNINSFRVGKGFLWALFMLPVWQSSAAEIPNKIHKYFTTGVMLGSLGVFLAVLWERGFYRDLFFGGNYYELLGNLLNFHTEYRVTGLFAEMHTGDAATDGYLILSLPLVAYFIFAQKNRIQLVLGCVSLIGVIYTIAVTFSRGLYLGVAVILLLLPLLTFSYRSAKIDKRAIIISIALAAVFVLHGYFLFKYGGALSLSGAVIIFLSCIVFFNSRERYLPLIFYVGFGLSILASIYAFMHGMLSSKWNNIEFLTACYFTGLSIAVFSAVGIVYDKTWAITTSLRQRLFVAFLFCVMAALAILSVFGSRMEARFETVNSDVQGRIAHWKNAIDIMNGDLLTELFGQGVGTFPKTYYLVSQRAKDVGGYSFVEEEQNSYVSFAGSADVKLAQRVNLAPNRVYNLSVDVRTIDPLAYLEIRICHRQLIQPFQWNPTCVNFGQAIKNTDGKWQSLTFKFPSDNLGSLEFYLKAPLVITFENRREYAFNIREQTLLDIDNLSIKSSDGLEIIKNGSFEAGIDNWFAYYDFNHMPWHIKNLFVTVYFDSGLMGIFTFGLLVAASMVNISRRISTGDFFSLACLLSFIGFFCVGCFGTMIDGPRIAFFFYFLILVNMLAIRSRHKKSVGNTGFSSTNQVL